MKIYEIIAEEIKQKLDTTGQPGIKVNNGVPDKRNLKEVNFKISEKKKLNRKILPGETQDDKYKDWNLRYQLRPKEGRTEFQGIAVHSKSTKTKPISAIGNSAEEVLNKLRDAIETSRGTNEIQSNRITVDFNSQLAKDIIGHGNDIWADIVKYNGTPLLLLSSENQGGMSIAQDRTALANRHPDRLGQQAFSMSGRKAIDAGLTHARYSLGKPVEYTSGVMAFPLEFRSEVYPGDIVKMGDPGVTIAHPRGVMAEAGPFSYGAKTPRKGSVAYNIAQKRKELDKQPIEPRDQMVGIARITKDAPSKNITENQDVFSQPWYERGIYNLAKWAFKKYQTVSEDDPFYESEEYEELANAIVEKWLLSKGVHVDDDMIDQVRSDFDYNLERIFNGDSV